MLSSTKNRKPVQSLAAAAVALSQCWMLSACADKVTFASRPAPSALTSSNTRDNNNRKQPSSAPTPGLSPSPGSSPTPSPSPVPGTFAASLDALDFDSDVAHGVLRLSFSTTSSSQSSSVGPLVASLSAAAGPSGADMVAPPGVLDYSAHIACQNTDCSKARVTLAKRQAPLDGQAVINIHRTTPGSISIESAGTPAGLHAQVISALQSQGLIETRRTLKQVENGATFFEVDCRIPRGAIVPGQPATDDGRRVIVTGRLGEQVTVGISYIDTEADVASGMHDEFGGASASYSESDHTIRVSLTGNNRIRAMAFGDFRSN